MLILCSWKKLLLLLLLQLLPLLLFGNVFSYMKISQVWIVFYLIGTVHLMCQPKLGFLYDPKLELSGRNYLIEVFVLILSWFTRSILMSILSFVSEIFVELGWKLYLLRSSGIMQLLVLVKLLVWLRKV